MNRLPWRCRPHKLNSNTLQISARTLFHKPAPPPRRIMADHPAAAPPSEYVTWTNEQLIKRVLDLEAKLRDRISATTSSSSFSETPPPKKLKPPKPFDPSKYIYRRIALKFAYLGARYNGFEHHVGNVTPLPAIEEEIWKALVKCRLIFPPSLARHGLDTRLDLLEGFRASETPVDWEGCGYSKCGRTDRGVSAFGQVIGITVRSAQRKRKEDNLEGEMTFDHIKDELNYIDALNRVLPQDIRMLAWCPAPSANFDARFSCKEREYRYFFTNPAFLPIPDDRQDRKSTARLDIEAMQEAAQYFVGSHDFRNFCKIDPAKQLTEFTRIIRSVDVLKVSDLGNPRALSDGAAVYCVRLTGSAFLWHQVRCMVAILFLVGQGLERPQIVKQLLDVGNCDSKPAYEMASDRPLVLWDCRFSLTAGKVSQDGPLDKPLWDRGQGEDELEWIYPGDAQTSGKWNRAGIMEDLWSNWRGTKMDDILASSLFDLIASRGSPKEDSMAIKDREKSIRVFQGEDTAASAGIYVPLMKRKRLENFEIANARWIARRSIKKSDLDGSAVS